MRILIAPQAFKGSAAATLVAAAIATGLGRVWPLAELAIAPIADGGEGTVDAMIQATGGTLRQDVVSDPLGSPVVARWGVLGDEQTAVIEMAAASGLSRIPAERRNPLATTTYGTGELICLEVNTQPGMTGTSLVPELAAHAGWPFGTLVRWIIEDASCNR